MKHSMKRQFAFIFIGLMACTILVCWIINNTLLERYYLKNKEEAIYASYDRIQESIQEEMSILRNLCQNFTRLWESITSVL